MCRICGRMIKCIFDSMPSRVSSTVSTRSIATATRPRPSKRACTHVSSSSLVKSALDIENGTTATLPTFLIPIRARLHQATTTQQAATTSSENASTFPPSMLQSTRQSTVATTTSNETPKTPAKPVSTQKPLVLSKSLQQLLPSLAAQKPHYITAHIHRFPYLLQQGDTLRLPFHMHGVSTGDILRLNRASILGSRDFTLKAGTNSTETYDTKRTGEPNYLDERLFEVRARVASVDSGPMSTVEKTKRRNRKLKTVRSKHKFTVLKIMQVRVKTLEELMAEKESLLLES